MFNNIGSKTKIILLRVLPLVLLMAVTVNGSEKKAIKGGEKHLSALRNVSGTTQIHNKQPVALPDTATIFMTTLSPGL